MNIWFRILVVIALAVPSRGTGEIFEGDPFQDEPPPMAGKADPGPGPKAPDFPPGVGVGPGPGFDQDEPDAPLGDPSQVGARSADLAYAIAGLVTLASAYFSQRAVRTTGQAFHDLLHRSQREAELAPLVEALEEFSRKHPEVVRRLEQHHEQYTRDWEKLQNHLDGLKARRDLVRNVEREMDWHLDKLLELPLLKRRTRVKEDLADRIAQWKKDRKSAPLMEWIAENQTKDVLRSPKGTEWQRKLETLRRDLAYSHWKENRTLIPMDTWLETLSSKFRANFASPAWQKDYQRLKHQELASAEKLVGEVHAFAGRISEVLGPEVLGPLLSLGDTARQPGNFLLNHNGSSAWIPPEGVFTAATNQCNHWLGELSGRAKGASARYTARGIGRRLVIPGVPVAAGLTVGGYYSYEGLRYYLMPDDRSKNLPPPPKELFPDPGTSR